MPKYHAPQHMTINDGVPVQLPVTTVAQMHAYFSTLMERGHADLPVVACDGRAVFPINFFDILSPSGYLYQVLIEPRPDCHFEPVNERAKSWNADADRIRESCGAFYF